MTLDTQADLALRFASLPPSQRALFYQRLAAKGVSFLQFPIPRLARSDAKVELSYAQQRQWFLWQLEPQSAAYHIPAVLRLHGAMDKAALQRSFVALIERHEVLRTTFHQQGDENLQQIHASQPLAWREARLAEGDEAGLQAQIDAEIATPFDLQQGPLLRVLLLEGKADEHVLVLTLHHIVADGWSTPIMVEELLQLYRGFQLGDEVELPSLPIQYADYALWQRSWMEAGERERQLGYWQAQLGGEQPVLELPTDHPRPAVQQLAGDSLRIELDASLGRSLRELAQEQGVTLFMLLLASFQTLLHRYSGQPDIRVGVPIANRTRVETERLIGFFVNTQVLKADFAPELTFIDLLQQVKCTALAAQAHQDLPFEQLVEALQPQRSLSHSPLFQVMFNHQRATRETALELPGLKVEALERASATAQFDLTLDTYESAKGDALEAALVYATSLFERATVERLARHWRTLLEGICQDPTRRLVELPLLDEADQAHLRQLETSPPGAAPACLHRLLEAQARRCPEAPAVICGEQRLSYGELQHRANLLARRLRAHGVGPEVPVGICLTRSPDLVVALLAVLKAGGAYVPLDPAYPSERLVYLIEDSRSALLLTQAELQTRLLAGVQTPVLCVDELAESSTQGLADENDASDLVQPQNLAYVIYTSGSTGRPKGVGISHQALVNHMLWMLKRFELRPSERVLQRTSASFDAAVWEFWLPLLAGAQLHLAPAALGQDLGGLWQLVERQRISVLQLPPSLLQALLPLASPEQLRGLRLLCCGGEVLGVELVRTLRDKWDGELLNLYGPTEATIDTCCHLVPAAATGPTIALGKPIDGLRVYLLDPSGGRTPWGGRGELAIAGAGLARGYLRRPGLTAERFVPDPEGLGERMYRSGDLARIDGEGQVDYLGRIDQQVKLRGYRIELGEIEARLLQQPAVRQAVVVAREGASGLQLVGYVVPSDPERTTSETLGDLLKTALRTELPEFMVPAAWVVLEALPLTPNGKLDRRALPPPDFTHGRQAFQVPSTTLERTLAAVWSEVLQIDQVGLDDDFFALGGHSLLATQILTRLRERLDIEVTLRDLFEFPILGELALQLNGRSGKGTEVQDKLAKSMAALKRLTTEEIDALTS